MVLVRAVWHWLQIVGGVLATTAICWLAAQYAFHLRLLNVQTGSMQPAFRPGDALIMRQASRQDLHVGAIVAYHSPRNPSELVTHRVVKVVPGSFQSKGDALTAPDPAVRDSLLAGRVVAMLPGLGRPLNWLRSWWGLAICVYLPAAAMTASELRRLERQYARIRAYRLHEKQMVS